MKLEISGCGILGIVFIVLKLTEVINWSWWWVLSPFWIPAAIMVLIGLVVLAIGAFFIIADLFSK